MGWNCRYQWLVTLYGRDGHPCTFLHKFRSETGSWIIENHGVDPDILIDNDPVKEWNGEDQQLDRAIQEVMKELQDRKPLPGVPTPRDFSK